jgi:hypothetical protein
MIRTSQLVAAMVGVALIVAGGTAAATAGDRDRCARKGSVTLVSTTLVRVYRDRHTFDNALVYACHRPTGHATQLGAVRPQGLFQYGGLRATAVRGSTVVYGLKVDPEGDEGSPRYDIVVVKLPFRGLAFEQAPRLGAVETQPFDAGADDRVAVERLFIAPNRTIAYTSCTDYNNDPDRCVRPLLNPRVVAVPYDSAKRGYGPAIVLDQSPVLDPRSLRLSPSGARLAWNDGELKRSVPTP